ncbi:MAG TPA: hypothetical protein VFZ59_24325 [Verrucomicrobiae bacterium]|nr:hypothetical protein [Verrucomicrobiae bacterium]
MSISPLGPSRNGRRRSLFLVEYPNGAKERVSFVVAANSIATNPPTNTWDAFVKGLATPKLAAFVVSQEQFVHELLKRSPIHEVVPFVTSQLTNATPLSISVVDAKSNIPHPARASDLAAQFLLLNVQEKVDAKPILPGLIVRTALGTKQIVSSPPDLSVKLQRWWETRGKSLLEKGQLEWGSNK